MNRHGQRNTLHPYAIHIYNTDRQTDNLTRTTDILATDCRYDIVIRLVPDSDFIWDFGKLPFPTHLGKYIIKIGKIRAKIHEINKGHFRIGNDSHIRPQKWPNKITA